ncbi:MAG: putative glycoside hydrolase [Gemmatimonadaceae bacterium]
MRLEHLATGLLVAAVTACGGDRSGVARHAPAATDTAGAAARAPAGSTAVGVHAPSVAPTRALTPVTDTATTTAAATPARPTRVRHLATPNPLRGLYVSRSVAQGPGIWRLIELAARTRVNALMFDVKDENGLVLYPSTVGLAHVIGADTVRAMPVPRLHALMDSLRKYRIYPVARIVVARDPVLAARRPQWALVHRADDPERSAWVDPRHREVWAYAADLASEAAARGFSEVDFDEVRFPASSGESERVELSPSDGGTLGEVIRAQLGFLRSRVSVLNIPMAITVDGLAAVDSSDQGVGQRWEALADRADVLMLRVYPSRYPAGTFGLADPGAQPYETVRRTIADAKRRNAAIRDAARIVPWYQSFTLGSPAYGDEQVRAQLQAGEDAGIRSWMLWNPAGVYSEAVLQTPVHRDSVRANHPNARAGGRSRH